MAVVNVWAGKLSQSGVWVRSKLDPGDTSARLAVDTDPAFSAPVFFGPDTPTADDMVSIEASGLDPSTEYFYAVEVDSVLDTVTTGRFQTLAPVGQPATFTFWAAGDAGSEPDTPGVVGSFNTTRISNHAVFDTIREHGPRFGIHLGDIHYYNPGQAGSPPSGDYIDDDVAGYRRCIDDVLLQPRQHQLYREVPLVWMYDDHDYGPNDSDGTHPGKGNGAQVYRERVPSYDLPDIGGAVYHSFTVGRTLFVILDGRFYRTPNSTPDGPSKTMLGAAQKAWLADLLTTSDAEFLIVKTGVQWLVGFDGSESWGSFATERQEIADLLTSTGWADRMVMLNADAHSLAMDDGASNNWGGFPVYLLASLDATPSGLTGPYNIGISNARNQYGLITIDDDGSTITLTARGYQGAAVIMQHQVTVQTEPAPGPPPDPGGLPQVAVAKIRTRLTWLSCNLSNGAVITELPDLQGDEVSRVIGEYTSANLSLPIPAVGGRNLTLSQRAHLAAISTEPARTMIVPVVNDVPTAGFIPLTRDRGTDATVQLGCVSLEGYLRHRYVRDHLWEGVDPAEIARGVLADAEDIDGNGQGLNLIVDAPDVNLNAGRYFQATDDETVYGALSEMMDAGLIEWTIDVDWRDGFAYRIVDKIARVRLRLGRSGDPTAVFQSATFSSQGASDARYALKAEHSGDRYGNWIVARGTGEGEDQPRSSAQIDQAALDSGAPIWEQRIQPDIYRSPLFTEAQFNAYVQEQLLLHATQELARIRGGSEVLEITARWDAPGARYGVDWQLGDDVLHELKGHAHPDGFNGVRRAIGFALSIQRGTIRPILQEEF